MKKFWEKYKKVIGGIAFTALCLLIWRIGVWIKLPFIDFDSSQVATGESIFGFLNICHIVYQCRSTNKFYIFQSYEY